MAAPRSYKRISPSATELYMAGIPSDGSFGCVRDAFALRLSRKSSSWAFYLRSVALHHIPLVTPGPAMPVRSISARLLSVATKLSRAMSLFSCVWLLRQYTSRSSPTILRLLFSQPLSALLLEEGCVVSSIAITAPTYRGLMPNSDAYFSRRHHSVKR